MNFCTTHTAELAFVVLISPKLEVDYADILVRPIIMHPWPATINETVAEIPYIRFCFEALDIEVRDIIFAKEQLCVDKLLVAPCNEVMRGNVSPHLARAFKRIRDYAHSVVNQRTEEKIYFSRRQFASPRKVANEEAVENLFRERGFAVVYPETLAFSQQVNIAANAKVIAGLDGSALHLAAFMDAGGTCLAIATRPKHRNRCYQATSLSTAGVA